MTPIISFLQDGRLPQDVEEARKVRKRAARFTILNDTLYKRGFSMPYLKCVDEEEAKYILKEIHEGVCGDHAGPISLVDAMELVKRCDKCQIRETDDNSLTLAFCTMGNRHHWSVAPRFGFPRTIISDNGWQFDSQSFRDFCSNIGIKSQFSSPRHPQANGQIEVTNRMLLKIIKAKLDNVKGAWPEELPNVLWAYRTIARTPTEETSFRLTYGTKAVIPVKVGVTSVRREMFREESNDD
ncbi:uncharacterized protein LOC126708137 [Quercus robur]|uniref:uncharacterized protein LOC126708137 n=1 Tax=Quercus robur TaxID=38942 RepID=UPI0021619F47|nr:uncharacterized protein LOC126708137 [Quercus robur]